MAMALNSYLLALIYVFFSSATSAFADTLSAEQLAAQYSLTTSTTLPFPTATQKSSDSQSLIVQDWSLIKGRIQDGASDLEFVNDPFPNTTTPGLPTDANVTGPVLQVTYPAGSFGPSTGGAQLENIWNETDGSSFQSMMVSYEVAFDAGFDWVQGGKLPGLRGGLNSTGCSGGNQPNGSDCFSTRIMWRPNGAGEVYAYIERPNNLCGQPGIICNPDFGISISRGSFSFLSGQWNRITMLVQLNNPPDIANGNILVYFNDQQVISQQNLQLRKATSVTATGLYLSTFFGGSDISWATPTTVHSYFRNFRLWGGNAPSTLAGSKASGGRRGTSVGASIVFVALLAALSVVWQ